MKTLDFNKTKKQFFKVILPDDEQTEILVSTPTKSIMTEVTTLQEELTTAEEDEVIDRLYEVCAGIMSRNKEGKEITVETLKCLDLEDLTLFLTNYLQFINEIASTKN